MCQEVSFTAHPCLTERILGNEERELTLNGIGNYYTLVNDYDEPARLFFSQACETVHDPEAEGAADEPSRMA